MAAPDPSAELMRMINWYQVSQALHVAAALGVADQLRDGQKSCDVVARACRAHPPSLYRLLRALAAVGVFHETANKEFSLCAALRLGVRAVNLVELLKASRLMFGGDSGAVGLRCGRFAPDDCG